MKKKSLFGTSGIRGHAEKLFTEQFCFDLGRTFIKFLKNHNELGPLAVSNDPRTSGPRIKKHVMKGLAIEKIEIFDEGVTPIPSINWLIKTTPVKAAIMVTGSHIAPELNGLKFYAHDEEISLADQNEIEKIYYDIKENIKVSEFNFEYHKETRARDNYSEMLFKLAPKKKFPKWKVGLDCANGAQSVVVPHLLKERFSFEVEIINCDIQKEFIARDTDTDDKAQLEGLKELVKSKKCDFGVAFDGDGDRVVFINEKGEFVQGEYSCGLVAQNSDTDVVVTPISSSQVVDQLGKKIVRTKVGSPYVIEKMKETGAKFGFEANGGAFSAEIMYTRDGGSMMMKMLNLYSNFKGSFSELIGELPKYYMFRTKVDYKWELQDKILKEAQNKFKGIKVEKIDGLKIWLDDNSWILFRSSQNAPEFRVFAESKTEKKAKDLLESGIKFVQDIILES